MLQIKNVFRFFFQFQPYIPLISTDSLQDRVIV